MTEKKKPWVEPELIVLVRNNPEEGVLETCKLCGTGLGYLSGDGSCMYLVDFPCQCCDQYHSS